ncbi:MAG TPA: hypothetical protein VLK22_02730 [Candidatus Udaeobacter sp.]|nr:hypothetical protein [Candidatus Udaeobacter sp.]
MKEPTYRQTLSHAWDVVWHNKALWILGLFSVLLGQFGFSDIFGKIWAMLETTLAGQTNFFLPVINLNWSGDVRSTLGIVWLAGIVLSIVIFLIFLAVTSQGALIFYASEWLQTKKHPKLSKPWGRSLKNFWSILLVNVLRQAFLLLLLALFWLVFKNFIYSPNFIWSLGLAVALTVVLLVSLFVSVIFIFTLCALVIDNKGFKAAIAKAYNIFSQHLLVSLEVGVLLMLLNFLLLIAAIVAAFFAFLPAVLIWLLAGLTNLVVLAAVGFAVGVFLWVVLIVLIAGFFNAYTTSAWVFLFVKMHKEGINSRVIHFFKHMLGK